MPSPDDETTDWQWSMAAEIKRAVCRMTTREILDRPPTGVAAPCDPKPVFDVALCEKFRPPIDHIPETVEGVLIEYHTLTSVRRFTVDCELQRYVRGTSGVPEIWYRCEVVE